MLFANHRGNPETYHAPAPKTPATSRSEPRAKFHTDPHKLHKTGASRRYLTGVPLKALMQEIGHESLATTQQYLPDVNQETRFRDSQFHGTALFFSGQR